MNRASSFPALSLFFVVFGAVACSSSDSATTTPSTPLSDTYRRLGDNFGSTLAQVKTSATTAGAKVPAELAGVAAVPKDATGGVDITAEQRGKTGANDANIDGIGGNETVTVFVPDAPTGTGTSASLPSFGAWKGDADSNDAGLCYLGFTKGTPWFVVSKCGDTSGAWVCQAGSDITCNACNTAGACNPCDLTQSKFTCAW